MSYFNNFHQILRDGDTVNMTIMKKGDELTISLMPGISCIEDSAKEYMKPLIITATPVELDKDFFEIITEPIESGARTIANIKEYEQGLSSVHSNSKLGKAETEAQKKEREAYNKLLQEAQEQEKANNYSAAYATLKKASVMKVADTDKINKRLKELQVKMSTGSLFQDNTEDTTPIDESNFEVK